MAALLVLLVIVAGGWALAYFSVPLLRWTLAGGLLLLVLSLAAPAWWLYPLWFLWGLVALANIAPVRQRLYMAPMLRVFRGRLPSVSATEREALEAGGVWWDAELFSGHPNWQRFLEFPKARLTEAEQVFLDGPAEELCRMLDDWRITFDLKDLPPNVWAFIRRNRFFGMIIPTEYGGLGFSAEAHSHVVAKVASRSGSAAVTVMVPNSLGPAELLLHYGTDAQKSHYLPRLADGREIPCFALTNPYAGSDASSIPDKAVVCQGEYQGQQVLGMRVTWEKRYITLAPVATVLGLAFQLYDPERLLGGEDYLGITLALIPTGHPGVRIGRRHFPLKQAFQNGPTSGTDVFIPMDMVIGGRAQIGQGWRMLMERLAVGRSISLPALAAAAIKFCARNAGAYARVRKQFKLPIGRFEGIEEVLARIAGDAYAVEAARRLTTAALDQGFEPAVISALLKYQTTERQRQAINDAMDIHGGRAICEGPSNYLANAYQGVPVSITVEGANILTRSLIVFGQGAIRCHPWVLKELEAAQDPDPGRSLEAFDTAICGHVGHLLNNLAQAAFHHLTLGRFMAVPRTGPVARYYAGISCASLAFALMADGALLVLGGQLKRRERLSGRFADVLSEMYFAQRGPQALRGRRVPGRGPAARGLRLPALAARDRRAPRGHPRPLPVPPPRVGAEAHRAAVRHAPSRAGRSPRPGGRGAPARPLASAGAAHGGDLREPRARGRDRAAGARLRSDHPGRRHRGPHPGRRPRRTARHSERPRDVARGRARPGHRRRGCSDLGGRGQGGAGRHRRGRFCAGGSDGACRGRGPGGQYGLGRHRLRGRTGTKGWRWVLRLGSPTHPARFSPMCLAPTRSLPRFAGEGTHELPPRLARRWGAGRAPRRERPANPAFGKAAASIFANACQEPLL